MGQFSQAVQNSAVPFDPYTSAGGTAMQQLMAQMGMGDGQTQAFDVTQLPGYQQSQTQGINAVNQGAASAGMLNSGERLKSLQSSGQSVFGDYYNNYMNRLMGIGQQGMGAATSAASNLTNNLNALTQHRMQVAASSGGGGGPMGDILSAGASMYGTYSGGQAGP